MHRALLLMIVLGTSASGLSLTGPSVPAPYSVTGNSIDGPFQVVTANRQVVIRGELSGTYDSLLVVRDSRSGKTLWKTYLEGALRLKLLGKGQGVVVLSAVEGGAITRGWSLLYRLKDGRRLAKGLFEPLAIEQHRALLIDFGEPGGLEDQPLLTDFSKLSGKVMDIRTGETLTRDFPVPNRPGCGQFKIPPPKSNQQAYVLQGKLLSVPRTDACGSFQANFEWTKVPLPPPALTSPEIPQHID